MNDIINILVIIILISASICILISSLLSLGLSYKSINSDSHSNNLKYGAFDSNDVSANELDASANELDVSANELDVSTNELDASANELDVSGSDKISDVSANELDVSGSNKTKSEQRIIWPNSNCYPKKFLASCKLFLIKLIKNTKNYGAASLEDIKTIKAELSKMKYDITFDQLLSMRSMEVAYITQFSGVTSLKKGPRILKMFEDGDSIMNISNKLNLPPLSVLRQLLVQMKYSVKDIKSIVTGILDIDERITLELPILWDADMSSKKYNIDTRKNAQNYEDNVGKYLTSIGVKFKTENELRDNSEKLTPDFLLNPPVYINDSLIFWIDAKNYIMYGSRLVARGLVKQANKYTEAFGPGAMVFSGGVVCDTPILDKKEKTPLLLDGSKLNRL